MVEQSIPTEEGRLQVKDLRGDSYIDGWRSPTIEVDWCHGICICTWHYMSLTRVPELPNLDDCMLHGHPLQLHA